MRILYANKPGKELLYIRVMALPNHVWLGVGYNGGYFQNAGEAIIQAFIWGFVLVILLGGGGGLYLSRAFLRKIDKITKSTQAIIAGDLKHRLPVSKNRDELDNLALLLNQMLDKIGTLIENIQQVSNDIAHDLRTPLSHLKFRLEDALTRNLPAEQYKERITFAILTIADNGPGIAEAYRQKVFQRFYRLEQSRTTSGNGLGLSIAAAIIDLHEGMIALGDNNPGLKVIVDLSRIRNNKPKYENQLTRK